MMSTRVEHHRLLEEEANLLLAGSSIPAGGKVPSCGARMARRDSGPAHHQASGRTRSRWSSHSPSDLEGQGQASVRIHIQTSSPEHSSFKHHQVLPAS